MEKMYIAEFNIVLTTGPNWLQAYGMDQAKKFEIEGLGLVGWEMLLSTASRPGK